jgi:hypothetical protein
MKAKINIAVIALCFMLSSFSALHKYFVSVTDVEYVQATSSLQITSRLFIDDFEEVLQERYDSSLKLDAKDADVYVEKYFRKKLLVEINNIKKSYTYIGKEFDGDMVHCYFEIENVSNIQSIKVTNKLLMDVFEGQQNITHVNVNNEKKSFLLMKDKTSGLLKLNK